MSMNDELAAIEAAVNECEKGIATGTISVNAFVSQIQSIADPNASIAKNVEILSVLQGYIDRINQQRMRELKYEYPNDSRIRQLAHRVAEYFLTLMNYLADMGEALATPDVRLKMQAENQELRMMLKESVSDLLDN